jgi:hypothetical protein
MVVFSHLARRREKIIVIEINEFRFGRARAGVRWKQFGE